jgi:hypothetical protein
MARIFLQVGVILAFMWLSNFAISICMENVLIILSTDSGLLQAGALATCVFQADTLVHSVCTNFKFSNKML